MTETPPNFIDPYARLRAVLDEAFVQAVFGKGADRHTDSDGTPFSRQPAVQIGVMLGSIDGPAFQIMKKTQEACRMFRRQDDRAAVRELLGVINYAAAAIVLIQELDRTA